MEINTKLCNPKNHAGSRKQTKYIVIHWTSGEGDTAANNAAYFAREIVKASAHYFVDKQEIWASVPEKSTAYHVGASSYRHPDCRNNNSIGIEICMTGKGYALRPDAIANAARLTRMLMEKYDIPIENVIRHYDVTGKNCPAPMVQDAGLWHGFKVNLAEGQREDPLGGKVNLAEGQREGHLGGGAAVSAEEGDEMKVYNYVPEMPEWAQDTFTRLVQAGYVAKDAEGKISVLESTLQPMVYLDRLTGGKIEKLHGFMRTL